MGLATETRLDADLHAARSACGASYERLLTGLVGYLGETEPEDATPEQVKFAIDTIRDLIRTKAAADGDQVGPIRRRDVERAIHDASHVADTRERIDYAAKLLAARLAHRAATRRVRRYRVRLARARFREQHETSIQAPAQAGRHRRASGRRPGSPHRLPSHERRSRRRRS